MDETHNVNKDRTFQQQRQTKPQLLTEVLDPSFHTSRPLKLWKKRKVWANAPIHQQLLHHMSAILRLGQIDDVICWDSRTDFPEVSQIPDERGGGSVECCLLTFELLKDDLPLLMAAKLKKTLQHPHRVVSKRHLEVGQRDENCNSVGTLYPRYLKCPEGQCVVVLKCQSHLTWSGQAEQDSPVSPSHESDHEAPSSAFSWTLCHSSFCGHESSPIKKKLHMQSGLS